MSAGRKRTTEKHYSAEDQALDQISKEAEERSQARRQARTEARDIRLKEIERQQKEEEERQKEQGTGVDASKSASSYSGSRRGSDDSTDTDISSKDTKDPKDQAREMKHQLKELEEKYKAAMVTNAQLDNIKTSQIFQIELIKEQIEEQEEAMLEVQREYRDKCREYELLKRDSDNVKFENESIKRHMEIKDRLLKESGLVVLVSEEGEFSLTKCGEVSEVPVSEVGTALLSEDVADALKKAGDGSLDDRLKKILAEWKGFQEEINSLKIQLENERSKKDSSQAKTSTMNGPELQLYEIQREASKQIHEYKLKLQKAQQEITNLDGTVNRLETQVKRFKYDAEEAERLEDELKLDRKRLQRELRECQNQIEELQNQNKHLNNRLEQIRKTRNALGITQ